MALTVTEDRDRVERISRNFCILTGSIAFDSSYVTGGMDLADMSKYFSTMKTVIFEGEGGYVFEYDKTNDTVVVYNPADVTNATEAAHTHAVALDGGDSDVPDGTNVVVDTRSVPPSLFQRITPVSVMESTTEVASWTLLDLGSHAPSQTDAFLLRLGINDDTAMSYVAVKNPDDAGGRGESGYCYAHVVNQNNWQDIICGCPRTGANGQKIHYVVSDATGSTISDFAHIELLGYWRRVADLPNEAHTHAFGTLVDAASAAGSAHTHVATAGAEVSNGTNLSGITALQFIAVGLKD